MDVSEIEKLAAKGEEMPEGLITVEQSLFLSLRCLYREYRNKWITKEQAHKEKMNILKEYSMARFYYNVDFETAQMRIKLSAYCSDIQKNGCEYCKQAVNLFDFGSDIKLSPTMVSGEITKYRPTASTQTA